jgi:hypothetical protein
MISVFSECAFGPTEESTMLMRVCAACGETKDLRGGKICEKGHFICSSCQRRVTKCPIDAAKLR